MAAGRAFLSGWLPAHEQASFLHGHLSWHVALTALEAGDLDGALGIYRQHIRPSGSRYPPLNVFTDCASLLWRLSLAGKTGLEPHWQDVAVYGDRFFPRAGAHFADVHYAWSQRQRAPKAWKHDWRNWKRLRPTAGWRRVHPPSSFVAACGHLPRATMKRDPHSRTADAGGGADRRQPCAARAVGGHLDRGLSSWRPRRQGGKADLRSPAPQAIRPRRGLVARSPAELADRLRLNRGAARSNNISSRSCFCPASGMLSCRSANEDWSDGQGGKIMTRWFKLAAVLCMSFVAGTGTAVRRAR